MSARFAGVLVATCLASACGGISVPPDMAPPEGSVQEVLRLRFRRAIVSPLDLAFRPTERSTPEVDLDGGRVFVGTSDHHLYCLRAADGATVWRFRTYAPVETEPLYAADTRTVYFASGDGTVYALDARTGRPLWRHSIRMLSQRRPVVTSDAVYVAAGGTSVFAIDRKTGERLWAYRREAPGGFTIEGQAGLSLVDRRLYTGFSDGVVVALSALDGTVEWERDTSVDIEEVEGAAGAPRYLDVDTTPVVLGENVYAASYGGGVYALQSRGGGVGWRRDDLRGTTGLAGRGGVLYASVTGRGLVALEAETGETIWRAPTAGGGLSEPVLRGDFAYVTSAGFGLYVVRLVDGSVVQAVAPGRGAFGAPAVAARSAFFLSNSTVLYGLDIDS